MKERRDHGLLFAGIGAAGIATLLLSACGNDSPVGGSSSGNGVGGTVFSLESGGMNGSNSGAGGAGDTTSAATWPPAGFINVTNTTSGAYALGPEISNGATATGTDTHDPATVCAGLFGVVRDFKMGSQPGGHPDFETARVGNDTGIVENTLGSDGKPVYAHPDDKTSSTTGKANFDQWYRDVPDVNRTFILGLQLVSSNGISTFSAVKPNFFFPLDDQGFGNEGQPHNFSFTTEIHTAFTYQGGETFTFVGDDDVWVFIDNKLVIDLGGRHAQLSKSVDIDSLGLTLGSSYDIAVFHAERYTTESNFQIQTTLAFSDCGQVNGVIY